MHLDQERLLRFLHGELFDEELQPVRNHLAECPACGSRLHRVEEEETEILDLLASLDHPTPTIHPDAIRAKARTPQLRWGRWAAGIVLALGVTSAAYAAPGSPLPTLLHSLSHRLHVTSPDQTGASEDAVAVPSPSGIAVTPGAGLSIQFSSPQTRGLATVELTEQSDVIVRALDGVPGFTSDFDRLLIENEGSESDFEIQIPRSAPWIEIRVGEDIRFSKVGELLTASIPADEAGRFLIPLHPPGS